MRASRIKTVVFLTVAGIIATACGGGETDSGQNGGSKGSETITLGLPTSTTSFANADVAVAEEQGFFEEQNLKVDTRNFGSGVDVSQAVVSGDLQIGASSIEPVVQAASQGANFSIVGGYTDRLTVSMVTPKSITSAADLRGKNLGIQDVGAFREIMTRLVLQTEGLTPDDVQYRPIEATAYIGSLLSDQISSGILQAEQTVEVMNQDDGFHELVDLYEVEPDYYYGTYFVDKAWLTENEDTAVRFLTGITKAHRFMYENRDETVSTVAETTGFDKEVIDDAYEKLLLQNGVFAVNEGLEEDRLEYTLRRMEELDLLKGGAPSLSDIVDRGPISKAVEDLGPLEGDPRWH
jgi:ABC-type nitrate/sulfonate/bicarbonate transport system substrate-binding protein